MSGELSTHGTKSNRSAFAGTFRRRDSRIGCGVIPKLARQFGCHAGGPPRARSLTGRECGAFHAQRRRNRSARVFADRPGFVSCAIRGSRAASHRLLDRLATDVQTDSLEETSTARIRELSQVKLDELAQTIQLRREKGLEAAMTVVRTDVGEKTMNSLRSELAKIVDRETDAVEKGKRLIDAGLVHRGGRRDGVHQRDLG